MTTGDFRAYRWPGETPAPAADDAQLITPEFLRRTFYASEVSDSRGLPAYSVLLPTVPELPNAYPVEVLLIPADTHQTIDAWSIVLSQRANTGNPVDHHIALTSVTPRYCYEVRELLWQLGWRAQAATAPPAPDWLWLVLFCVALLWALGCYFLRAFL